MEVVRLANLPMGKLILARLAKRVDRLLAEAATRTPTRVGHLLVAAIRESLLTVKLTRARLARRAEALRGGGLDPEDLQVKPFSILYAMGAVVI